MLLGARALRAGAKHLCLHNRTLSKPCQIPANFAVLVSCHFVGFHVSMEMSRCHHSGLMLRILWAERQAALLGTISLVQRQAKAAGLQRPRLMLVAAVRPNKLKFEQQGIGYATTGPVGQRSQTCFVPLGCLPHRVCCYLTARSFAAESVKASTWV